MSRAQASLCQNPSEDDNPGPCDSDHLFCIFGISSDFGSLIYIKWHFAGRLLVQAVQQTVDFVDSFFAVYGKIYVLVYQGFQTGKAFVECCGKASAHL